MTIDSDTGGQAITGPRPSAAFSIHDAKTELRLLSLGARVLVAVFIAAGLIIMIAAGHDLDTEPTVRATAFTLLGLGGTMIIGVGALRGHLTILRAAEQLRAEIHQLRAEEQRHARTLDAIADAAEDQLGQRRDGR